MFQLTLVDPKTDLCKEWNEAFNPFPEVEVVNGYFEEIPNIDCMVSAANSFGLMDGGVDLAIINHFGDALEKRIQQHILDHYFGEQSVGTSFIIDVLNGNNQYVAHTPTMRVPMAITETDNVYIAMKAMLEAVWKFNKENMGKEIKKVACPGLGTATGRMPFKETARQMALAYKNFIAPNKTIDWRIAQSRQQAIRYGGNLRHKF